MARKRKRRVRPGRLLFRAARQVVFGITLGPRRNWPSVKRTGRFVRRKLRMGTVASWRRDPATGGLTMSGMTDRGDGRLAYTRPGKPAQPQRPGRPGPQERAAQRRTARQQRAGHSQPARQALGMDRDEAERLLDESIGAAIMGAKHLPQMMRAFTPAGARNAPNLTQISCDWCKGTSMRPVYVDNGTAFRIVTGVAPCAHTPFLAPGMPFQPPPGPNGLLCPPCQNTGLVGNQACTTCRGWIVPWSEYGRKTPARAPRRSSDRRAGRRR